MSAIDRILADKRTSDDLMREMDNAPFEVLGKIEYQASDRFGVDATERLQAIAELLRGYHAKRERLRAELSEARQSTPLLVDLAAVKQPRQR